MDDYLIFGISLGTALVCSHVCSLMEAALLSLTPSQLGELRRRSPVIGKTVQKLKSDIDNPLAVILIINTAAHTIGAAVAGASFDHITGGRYMSVFSLAFTLIMVQYTEILPKTLGVRFNTSIMRVAARPLQVLGVVLLPFIKFSRLLNRVFESRRPERPSTADEISALAALARSSQIISSRQERIIKMVPHLSERTAIQVMIDVDNISFLHEDMSISAAINVSARDFHTRYPVRSAEDPDRILGYINIKELVNAERSSKGDTKLTEIMRPIGFAEPDDSAAELLEKFAAQHCHMTIVRNPADGKVRGLVTLEDIVEELFGEIEDEHDVDDYIAKRADDGSYLLSARLEIERVNEMFGLRLPVADEYQTIAGFILYRYKNFPKMHEVIQIDRFQFKIMEVESNKIELVALKIEN